MPWGVAAAVGGALITADGAKSAASAQSGASDNAIQAQMLASAQMQTALQPWTQAGGQAQSRLNQLLGLGGVGGSGRTSLGLSTGLSPDQVRQQLLSRYTRQSTAPNAAPMYRTGAEAVAALGASGAHDYFQNQNTLNSKTSLAPLFGATPEGANVIMGGGNSADGVHGDTWEMPGQAQGPASTIDEEGLNAAIAKYYEEQDAQNSAAESDPAYGSLLRAYRNGEEFDSGPAFSFTGKDLASDPGYKFGLDQGTQGIERGQASRGNFLSGAAMKELDRFNQDYAGTKFDNAFNRNLNTYSTNLNRRQNEWNTNLGAYNQNRGALYDMLSGVSRTGQNSAAQVGTSNIASANSIGNAMIGQGNAQAAGTVASTNGLLSGINSAVNSLNTNNPNSAAGWNTLLANQGGGYSGYTGYGGGSNDAIANLNTTRGWT